MKIPPLIKDELDNCGLPFSIEKSKKHYKIFISNVLCGIFPAGANSKGRAEMNVRSQIRRFIRNAEQGQNQTQNAST